MRVSVSRLGGERFGFWRDAATRRSVTALFTIIVIVFANTLVGGCAIKLAPSFDQAIFDGLTKANVDAMKLFASTSSGAYEKRAKAYDDVIGELNAVQVQIAARATPTPPAFLLWVAAPAGNKAKANASEALVPPTAADVDTLVKIMTRAKLDDRKGRLRGRVDFLKEAFAIQMAQALTYEKALQ